MKKYRSIILFIGVLVLFNIAVAVASYLISNRIDTLNAYRAAISDQQVALDKLSKNIIDINMLSDRFEHGTADMGLIELIENTYDQVSDSKEDFLILSKGIQLFDQGGTLSIGGSTYTVPAPSGEVAVIDQRIDELWQPFSSVAGNMITQFEDVELIELNETLRFAADYVRKYSEPLGGYLAQLSNYYQAESDRAANQLRLLQIAAITFTILFFAALTFWGLRSLIRSDREVEKAQQETSNIMKTVNEGLFLIDEQLHIGTQYSAELEEIIGQKDIAGRELGELLAKIVSHQDYETTKDFIEQLFNAEVVESLIHELNPLDRIRVYVVSDEGVSSVRYLSFSFSRVHDEQGNIINVLISVADITRQVMLEERMEKERIQHDEQIELLSSILSIPSASLNGFIRNANEACQKINYILRGSKLDKGDLLAKANSIFREAHGMKGEASALGLRHFISIAEDMEERVTALKRKHNLSGRDFLPLTIDLDRTLNLTKKIIDLQQKINRGESEALASLTTESDASILTNGVDAEEKQLSKFVNDVAARNHKQVDFSLNGWAKTHILEQHHQDKLREVVIQLLRNAVVHGIESSDVRVEHNKPAIGNILCDVKQEDQHLMVFVHDDGRGIDFQALQQKALADGKVDLSQSPQHIRQDLIKYMFSSGTSTASSHNEDAGRGVGMDVVKSRVQELKANIALNTKEGLSTTFKIQIPLAS